MEDKLKSFIKETGLNPIYSLSVKPIIVVDINFLPDEDKINTKNLEDKYNKLFEGCTVVFIDSSKRNTQQSNSINHPPIYKL